MTWKPDRQAETQAIAEIIRPLTVFYAYDGPAIFTARIGFFETLFYKFNQEDDHDFFLAVPLRKEILGSLNEGALSFRGALQTDEAWVIEAEGDLSVVKWWSLADGEFPNALLPKNRIGIRAGLKNVVDSLDAARALLAFTFQGAALGRQGMPLGAFRLLVDNAHEAARRILIPAILANTRSATLDFEIAEPKFSSLVIALKEPLINVAKLEKRLKKMERSVDGTSSSEGIAAEIGINGTNFVHEMDEIASSAIRGEISDAVALERFIVLDQVSEIVPSEQNKLSELAIASNVGGNRSTVVIGSETGEKILRARKIAEARPVTDQGVVIQINAKQNTILLQSIRGREVTCRISDADFKTLRQSGNFDIGSIVRVTGPFSRRARRDLMEVQSLPSVLPRA